MWRRTAAAIFRHYSTDVWTLDVEAENDVPSGVGGNSASDVFPCVDPEQEQRGSSDPVNTTQRWTPLIKLMVRDAATYLTDATTPDAEAENGQPAMKMTKTPVLEE